MQQVTIMFRPAETRCLRTGEARPSSVAELRVSGRLVGHAIPGLGYLPYNGAIGADRPELGEPASPWQPSERVAALVLALAEALSP
ncbi:MAG TPA: hypothetical protein VNL15_03900 [Dehalococcoidia bacterium]|nr:hypothetical protein [Dehalococcoidia bacterium]